MSQKHQPVRGTQDILPPQSQLFRWIDQTAFSTAQLFGYEEIETPIFEFSDVFHRTLGETSDMVSKETYTFQDRGGDSLTLRPEGTAGIARAFISNGLAQNLPLKFYYSGPMFRYERPQKGRYRQFHQIGVECLGLETPESDVECIALAWHILKNLQISDKVQLEINSLGDPTSRAKHRDLLVEYLKDFATQLSEDSKVRLEKNPLRILDSKDAGDQKIIAGAPSLKGCMNQESQDFFARVLAGLDNLGLSYSVNDKLVRGIDYYTHTVFEFTTTHLGAQSAVIAGGRYDGLIEQMGGPKAAGVGWASGLERLSLLVPENTLPKGPRSVAVLAADDESIPYCVKLADDLRAQAFTGNSFAVETLLSGKFGKRMQKADKMGATAVVIVGTQERNANALAVKALKTGEQATVTPANLFQHLKGL